MKKENYKIIEELRHELHRHPELSYNEAWTKKRLMSFLKEHTKLELHDGGKYFYAVYRAENPEKSRAAIAFRADFDALPIEDEIDKPYKSIIPGTGHKCGHDGHAATLCGLALELKDLKLKRDVYLLFQHAEETGQGAAEAMVFLTENPDIEEIFAYHNQPGEETGKILVSDKVTNCASKGMSIFMKGAPSHASLPEKGINPVFALANVALAIPELTNPKNYRGLVLCTVIQMDVGEPAFGTAAGDGVLRMTIRAESEAEMEALQNKIEKLSQEEAEKAGVKLRIEFQDEFPENRNAPESVKKIYRAAAELGYPAGRKKMSRGSEDFGHYTKMIPGAMFYVGGGVDAPSFHTPEYDFNDSIMENAVEMFKSLIQDEG